MELRDLELFVAVVEERGFRRAAERSFVTQPALTRRIAALERELGAVLLVRDPRGTRPTEAGSALLTQARATLRAARECREVVARARGRVEVLRLGLVSVASPPLVATVLSAFAAEHPDVRIVQRDLPPREQVRDLRDGRLDVAVLGRPADGRGLRFVRLLDARWTAAMPAGHPRAGEAAVDVSDLRGERLILFPRTANPPLYDHVLRAFSDADGRARVVQEPAQLHAALDLVRAGAGICRRRSSSAPSSPGSARSRFAASVKASRSASPAGPRARRRWSARSSPSRARTPAARPAWPVRASVRGCAGTAGSG
jgi:DNA-binding transcriptional LysR family regulator